MIKVEYLAKQELIPGRMLTLVNRLDNHSTVVFNPKTMVMVNDPETFYAKQYDAEIGDYIKEE
jgi:hypothetical protein